MSLLKYKQYEVVKLEQQHIAQIVSVYVAAVKPVTVSEKQRQKRIAEQIAKYYVARGEMYGVIASGKLKVFTAVDESEQTIEQLYSVDSTYNVATGVLMNYVLNTVFENKHVTCYSKNVQRFKSAVTALPVNNRYIISDKLRKLVARYRDG